MRDQVSISRAEYEALRTLARERIDSGPVRNRQSRYRRPKFGDPLTWQEQLIVDILREAGEPVQRDAIVTQVKRQRNSVGTVIPCPSSQVARIRDKLGHGVIRTVWQTKINRHGVRVIDQSQGASYQWVGAK